MRNFSGARVERVVYRSATHISEHAHDWAVLSLFVLGGISNETELGETIITCPSATLFWAGAYHSNVVGPLGFEQIEIAFDPAWLGHVPHVPVTQWLGGRASAEARTLARLCDTEISEAKLRAALRQFIERANNADEPPRPDWLGTITQRLRADTSLSVDELAKGVRRHPSWLGTAYKSAAGEGVQETAARFRVERAARQLRETDEPFAAIAIDTGFCDQSHMNRTFRRVLGRTPAAVRDDRRSFRQISA